MKRTFSLLVLSGLLLFAGSALAMSSTHYHVDWFTPLTTGGGDAASSTHYAVNLSIGQTAHDTSASSNYQASLGYWAGLVSYRLYLPVMFR